MSAGWLPRQQLGKTNFETNLMIYAVLTIFLKMLTKSSTKRIKNEFEEKNAHFKIRMANLFFPNFFPF